MELTIALVIVLGTVAGAVGFGRRDKATTMADWAVGGRRFGSVLFWFMNAGEVYTTFAVLGISGYAWALGAPAYLAFTSVSLSYAIGYWLMPAIWRAGRKHGLITQADFFVARYDAPWLGVVTGVVGIAALVVYVQIQLVSLSLIVQLTLGGAVSTTVAVVLAAVLMLAFVFVAGLRSAAFSAAVKDVLMVVIVVVLSVTVASKVGASSVLDVFRLAEESHPGIGKFPGLDPSSPTTSLVDILLYAYSAIGMLAPGVFLAFLWRRTTAVGVLAGIVVGFVALLAPFAKDFWAARLPEWEPGLIAMAINAVVVVAVSLVTRQPRQGAVDVGLDLSARRSDPLAVGTGD